MISSYKVLILEDSSNLQDLYYKYFSLLKFDEFKVEYVIVSTIEDLKNQCTIFRPDCVLLDLEINNESIAGLKVSEFYDINRCAVFSGILDPSVILECNKKGFFIFVQKPFKFETLKQIIYSFYQKDKLVSDIEEREEEIRRKFQENIIMHELLQEQFHLQNIILSNIPAIVYIKDENLKYITCNDKFLKLNNIPNIDNVIGKTDYDIFDNEKAKTYSLEDQNIIDSKKEIVGIFNSSLNRDKFIWTTTSKYPIFNNGKICGVIGIIIDVTDIIRLEKIIENTFDAIKDGICIVNQDKVIVKSNTTLNEWYHEFMPIVGKKCCEVFKNECGFCDDCPNFNESNSNKCEVKFNNYWFEIKYYPINHSGNVLCYRRNITDRKKLEEEQKKAKTELQEQLTNNINEWVKTSDEYSNSLLDSVNSLTLKTQGIYSKFSTKLPDKKSKKNNGILKSIRNYFTR